MWTEEDGGSLDIEDVAAKISNFAGAFIHGSTDDASCRNHQTFMNDCSTCQDVKSCVEQFQSHKCLILQQGLQVTIAEEKIEKHHMMKDTTTGQSRILMKMLTVQRGR